LQQQPIGHEFGFGTSTSFGTGLVGQCERGALAQKTDIVVVLPRDVGDMNKTRFSKAETRILEQYWKLGTCSVREILDSLPEEESVAYTTVQTLVYRLEQKGALRKVKKIGNAQLFEPAIDQNEYRSGLVRDLLDLFGGSPRVLVSNLLETGTITLKDLKALQNAAPGNKNSRSRGGKGHA
jgi:BlaI family penicillinase repressor